MGNIEGHDINPVRDDIRKELNLSRKITYKQFCKVRTTGRKWRVTMQWRIQDFPDGGMGASTPEFGAKTYYYRPQSCEKHVQGQPSDACLQEIPWSVRDAVSLYERLDASFNCLIDVPVELPLRLPHLNYINLAYNDLPTLPESFGLFFHLETLLLNNNKLKSLPASLAKLTKLEKLDLSHNALRELPDNLGLLSSLSRLNVCGNKLRKLPLSLGSCESLALVLATANRLVAPPQSICNEGSQAIIQWMKKNVPNGDITQHKTTTGNVFPRIRGSQLNSAVPNAHSAEAAYKQAQSNTTNTSSKLKTPLLPPLGATVLDPYDLRDRIVGLLYGAAVGDALGVATQGMTVDECQFHYNPATLTYEDIIRDEFRVRWRQGDWSDCFDQLVLVLDSLTGWGGVVDELEFAQRLKMWSFSGFKELGDTESFLTSTTIQKVLEDHGFLRDPHHAALAASESSIKGNILKVGDQGAVCRAVLLGIPQFHDLSEVVSNSVRICRSTHADRRCVTSAVMVSVIIALLLQGRHNMENAADCENLLEKARSLAVQHLTKPKHLEEFMAATSTKDTKSCGVDEGHPFEPIGRALPIFRARRSYRQSITDLVMQGGNSCVASCLSGALIGCSYGFSNLPSDWIGSLRKKQTDWLNVKINLLLDMMAIP